MAVQYLIVPPPPPVCLRCPQTCLETLCTAVNRNPAIVCAPASRIIEITRLMLGTASDTFRSGDVDFELAEI